MNMYKWSGLVLLVTVYIIKCSGLVNLSFVAIGLAWFNFILDSVNEIIDRITVQKEIMSNFNDDINF